MPVYIVSDNEFKNAIQRFGISNEKLNDPDYTLKKPERKLLSRLVTTFSADGDGEIPPITDVLDSLRRFSDLPLSYSIPIKVVSDFISKIKNEITIPGNHELAFRFYFGHDNNAAPGKLTYSIVIMPIVSPIITTSVRDHSKDIEKSLTKEEFFALVVSGRKIDIETDLTMCKNLLVNKDASGTFLVYFSFDRFDQFKTKLTANAENLLINFARTNSNAITILLTFTDSQNKAVPSSVMAGGIKSDGIFFDQGDLIPPPSPVSDSSF